MFSTSLWKGMMTVTLTDDLLNNLLPVYSKRWTLHKVNCARLDAYRSKSMCGIAGFTRLHKSDIEPGELIRRMPAPLTPRGPDGEGFHLDASIALGDRRLSVTDLAGDGRWPTIADGTI
jgi:hypothetical protein